MVNSAGARSTACHDESRDPCAHAGCLVIDRASGRRFRIIQRLVIQEQDADLLEDPSCWPREWPRRHRDQRAVSGHQDRSPPPIPSGWQETAFSGCHHRPAAAGQTGWMTAGAVSTAVSDMGHLIPLFCLDGNSANPSNRSKNDIRYPISVTRLTGSALPASIPVWIPVSIPVPDAKKSHGAMTAPGKAGPVAPRIQFRSWRGPVGQVRPCRVAGATSNVAPTGKSTCLYCHRRDFR